MRALLLCTGLIAGCMPGPSAETQLLELRVVAAVADPPEVGVGEPFVLTAFIADPEGEGAETALWSCLGPGECDETRAPLPNDGTVVADAVGVAPVPMWIAACAAGACDLDTRTDDDTLDPSGWLGDQPLVGATAGMRMTRITDAAAEDRAANPVIEGEPVPGVLEAREREELVPLRFVVPGAEMAYGLATTGGFAKVSYDVASDGAVTLEWYAPEEGEIGRLYVVFEAESGTAVWTADVTVP